MSSQKVMITIEPEMWLELQARCYARGIKDFRGCAGGFVYDALETGFTLETSEEQARYAEFMARHSGSRVEP